ncbi:MAG: hypothetical protein U0571_00020 [Candidatus Brocadia sapporoensis]|nr:MAG: hypothetical protein HBSAPP01_02890 [Candidatus Brocadia sapporoensis]
MQTRTDYTEKECKWDAHKSNLVGNNKELDIHKGRYYQGTTECQIANKNTQRFLPVLNKNIQKRKQAPGQ